ncbi:MAG: hypothetical protein JRE18_07655 [Deltaproteobacteria bacterium]|jgi:hypothetical protein|nr:hypothetical protein [Deltaproteobacteria bacterium]
MRTRRLSRVLVIGGCLSLLVTMAVPVMGKGRPEKPSSSIPVTVTMSYEGYGLATTCDGPLPMTQDSSGFMRADWVGIETGFDALLPIPWERYHPAHVGGFPFDGCHGGRVDGSDPGESGFEGYFILDPDGSGGVHLTSRFDYYWQYREEKKGNKVRQVQEVLELLEINGDLIVDGGVFDWTAYGVPQTVEGDIELRRFEKTLEFGGWTDLGTTPVTITITIDEA